jgi:hypothetical protein
VKPREPEARRAPAPTPEPELEPELEPEPEPEAVHTPEPPPSFDAFDEHPRLAAETVAPAQSPPPPPQQMPMPFAVHAPALPAEPEPMPAAAQNFDPNGPFIPDPEPMERPPAAAPPPREKTFDEMLNEMASFAGTAEKKQVENTEPAAADADTEAEVLADVREQFDTISAGDTLPIPAPEPMPEGEDVLELVDDVADDEDEDGWMSTLLEGRGDDRT